MLTMNMRKKLANMMDFDHLAIDYVEDATKQKNSFDCGGICEYDDKLSFIGMQGKIHKRTN